MKIKQHTLLLPRDFALASFDELLIVFLTKLNLLDLLCLTARTCCLLHLKLFDENFSKNSNLDKAVFSLLAFPLRTNLKLHNMFVTPKLVTKVITNLDSSKASGPGCIPLVVLKKCDPKLSYMLAELFNM